MGELEISCIKSNRIFCTFSSKQQCFDVLSITVASYTINITTIISLILLAFSAHTWIPLRSAIVFGLIAATGIALIVTPCLYLQLTPKTPSTLEG